MMQLSLDSVQRVYEDVAQISNADLYARLVQEGLVSKEVMERKEPIGKAGKLYSKAKRSVRFIQQTLKKAGVIEQVAGQKGVWELLGSVSEVDKALHVLPKGMAVIGFSTDLGVSVMGDCRQILGKLDEPISLVFTSLPYPLANPRKYGNKRGLAYIDFVLEVIEPLSRNLKRGGSIVLNFSNDIFESGSPARSTYLERLYIALEDELGLHLMDRITWHNPTKQPSPTQYCTNPNRPFHLKSAYEPIGWFTNDPHAVSANNRRILRPNSDQMKKLYAAGGDKRRTTYGDGAYALHKGSYATETTGTLQSNVISVPHACPDTKKAHKLADYLNLPRHSAMMPSKLVELFIRWLTDEGDIVCDPTSGSGKTGLAAERLNRHWLMCEQIAEYIQLQRALFCSNGFLN